MASSEHNFIDALRLAVVTKTEVADEVVEKLSDEITALVDVVGPAAAHALFMEHIDQETSRRIAKLELERKRAGIGL